MIAPFRARSLSLINFKNYDEAQFDFSPEVNCFVGENGSGKTNVLDALYYACFCKSYFNAIDSQNIKHEAPFFVVQTQFEKDESPFEIFCGLKRGQKKIFSKNKKEYQRLADHVGLFPAVIISPSDADLIKEGSEVRRKFVDGIISQTDRNYLNELLKYNKALLQRNALLKYFRENRTFDASQLEIWNVALVASGAVVFAARKQFLERFIPIFQHYYSFISGGKEEVSLAYSSNLLDNSFEEILKNAEQADRRAARSTEGVHKDDLIFLLNGHPVKRFGSQGQQKSYYIALKLAQFQFIKEALGTAPLLLLDDVFDKIDDKRVGRLLKLVREHEFGQIFISDTDLERVPKLFTDIDTTLKVFEIEDGKIKNTMES